APAAEVEDRAGHPLRELAIERDVGAPAPVLVVVERRVGVVLARPRIDEVVDQLGRQPARRLLLHARRSSDSARRRRPPRRRRRRLRGRFGSSSSSAAVAPLPPLAATGWGISASLPAARSSSV